MRELQSFECFTVGGAGTEKLTQQSIMEMLDAGYSMKKIASIGLSTATEQKKIDWGNNVAGDAGYTISAEGRYIHWFFDGNGYFIQ